MSLIENVSDTARWVAKYRAMESARPDAIFNDPYAERLAGERGTRIVNELKRGRSTAWAMIVRTRVLDEMILDRIEHGGVDLVVNLAAGLDARPWRLRLPAALRWVDVDLPEMVEYKRNAMSADTPVCEYESVAADLRDADVRRKLFTRLATMGKNILIVSEGLLIYLSPEHVADLARDLHAMPGAHWWLSDIARPMLVKMVQKSWGKELDEGSAPFLFAPVDSAAFFAPLGWRETRFRPLMADARRLRREPAMSWMSRALARMFPRGRMKEIMNMSGSILLEHDTLAL